MKWQFMMANYEIAEFIAIINVHVCLMDKHNFLLYKGF